LQLPHSWFICTGVTSKSKSYILSFVFKISLSSSIFYKSLRAIYLKVSSGFYFYSSSSLIASSLTKLRSHFDPSLLSLLSSGQNYFSGISEYSLSSSKLLIGAKYSAIYVLWASNAYSNAIFPNEFFKLQFIFYFSFSQRILTMFKWPVRAAQCSAVFILLFCKLMSAPFSIRNITTYSWLFAQAIWSAQFPSSS